MNIKTFAAEIEASTDIEITVLYETLTAARIASAHMVKMWKMLADMVDVISAELIKRGLKLPGTDQSATLFDTAWSRATDSRINNSHRLETA